MSDPPPAHTQAPALVLVAAVAENGVIGQGGGLPWRLKSDLQHFRAVTLGKPVVMGRKTFLSLAKPLAGRTNIVVSRDPAFGTPGAVVRTVWKTDDIWIRREFTLPEMKTDNLWLNLHHDEDAEIYFNGVLAAKVSGFVTDYGEVSIRPDALAALKAGKNSIAVHCHQTTGGQYIDLGLVEIK